jgi:hypothetical protein
MPIPNREPGLVISYAYLWHDEHRAGLEEGQKHRPSVIVLTVECEADGATLVTVLPIKRHLGLDDPYWIIVDDRRRVEICDANRHRTWLFRPLMGVFFISQRR